jgi:prolyl oligopeptidase
MRNILKMKNSFLLILFLGLLGSSCKDKSVVQEFPYIAVEYPQTEVVEVTDIYHGDTIIDRFRWLEVDTAMSVIQWVDEQNQATFAYLEQIPFRKAIQQRLQDLYNYTKVSSPISLGEDLIYYQNDGLQNQPIIYLKRKSEKEPEVLIDPNVLNPKGTTTYSIIGTSKDHQFAALGVQEAGSDWSTLLVFDIQNKTFLEDRIEWVKFSSAAWDEHGFYYSRYPAPLAGEEFSNTNEYHSVYYHQLGDPQEKDLLIYRDEKNPNVYHNVSLTEDGRFLILNRASGTDGFETWAKDLTKPDKGFFPLFTGFTNKNYVIDFQEDCFYVLTDYQAENYRLVKIPYLNTSVNHWEEVIPEKQYLLSAVSTGGGYLFANYLERATSTVYVYNFNGDSLRQIQLPSTGTVVGFNGKKEDKELFYTFGSFIYPPSIFRYHVEKDASSLHFQTKLSFNLNQYEEKQIFYPSKDGTMVSMFLVHKKGMTMDGNNPCYLYGYGGFNINLTPRFSPSYLLFLEQGGLIAIPNLRGGGEYGESWHKAGMLQNKQNVFDDFIAAAEYLIDQGYTNEQKIAIAGGSNGGLLVGACMTQRPELFAVALPAVGVLDMLRYHKFTVGWGWIPEYGSSEIKNQYAYLRAYSPYHNLREGVQYPATLITTADHDDRVVPAHSFKFAALLQKYHQGKPPVLIRIEKEAGHGAGKPISKIIEEQTDIWSFLFYNTHTPYQPKSK